MRAQLEVADRQLKVLQTQWAEAELALENSAGEKARAGANFQTRAVAVVESASIE